MSTENENKTWTPNYKKALWLSRDNYEYIMITDNQYEDVDNLENGENDNPFWVGQFYTAACYTEKGKKYFKDFRDGGDPDSTLALQSTIDKGPVSKAKPKYFYGIIHFDIFEKRDILDQNNKPVVVKSGDNKGNVMQSWQQVEKLKERKALSASPTENTLFWNKKFLSLPVTHFDQLTNGVREAASKLCLCGGHLTPIAYACGSCDNVLLDIEDTDLTLKEVNAFGNKPKRCRACGVSEVPVAIMNCDTCDDPEGHTMHQVIVKVKKQGEGPQTAIKIDSVISVADFKTADGNNICALDENDAPLYDEDLGTFVLDEELDKIAAVTWDFDTANSVPENIEVSYALKLEDGDLGYIKGTESYKPTFGNSKQKQRRRFRR